ncbi:MAG: hypothetical protein EBZ75_11495 [Oxalobacteraceae bacterium]|nr:hypothetical protein [Oxalobacteraceae bacterium]
MKQFTMLDDGWFKLVSYGNGLAYLIVHKPSQTETYIHGDDAAQFERELDAIEIAKPALTYSETIGYAWGHLGYREMATPIPGSR